MLPLAGQVGQTAAEERVPVGAEDAGGDDVVEGLGERVFTDVDRLGVVGGVAVEAVGVVGRRVAAVVGAAVAGLAEHAVVAQPAADVRAQQVAALGLAVGEVRTGRGAGSLAGA